MTNYIEPNVLRDEIGMIELIDSMGNDLTIINNARVSFNKSKGSFEESDAKLLKYLITHQHWSPFRGVIFQFRAKAPIFICRQWWKHAIASSYVDSQNQWNEVSMRYVDASDFDFYIPNHFRMQSSDNKQASDGFINDLDNIYLGADFYNYQQEAIQLYKDAIELGVSREQARIILPTSVYTEFIWTTSLQAVINFIQLREGKGAQSEITLYAKAIKNLCSKVVPETFKVIENI